MTSTTLGRATTLEIGEVWDNKANEENGKEW